MINSTIKSTINPTLIAKLQAVYDATVSAKDVAEAAYDAAVFNTGAQLDQTDVAFVNLDHAYAVHHEAKTMLYSARRLYRLIKSPKYKMSRAEWVDFLDIQED
jgi:transaldolase